MSKLHFLTKIAGIIAVTVFLAGCSYSLSYTVKDPVLSSIEYGRSDTKPVTLTIIDKRTGSDSVFLVKVLGPGGSISDSMSLKIDNIEDPISYFAQQMERELNSRRIRIKCVVRKTSDKGLVLLINRYQIVNIRATGFSPWEACHIFSGTIIDDQKKPIKAYFYNGKTPVWSMKEVEKPCFTIPVSIIIKEVASKISRAVFKLRSSDEKIDKLTTIINSETAKEEKDPYDRPFWKVLELGYTNNPNAMESLKKYAQDSDEFFSSCSLSAMGILGAEDQIDFLMQRYSSGSFNVKYMAAKAIGDIGTQEALQVLRDMKKDEAYINEGGLKHCLDLYAP